MNSFGTPPSQHAAVHCWALTAWRRTRARAALVSRAARMTAAIQLRLLRDRLRQYRRPACAGHALYISYWRRSRRDERNSGSRRSCADAAQRPLGRPGSRRVRTPTYGIPSGTSSQHHKWPKSCERDRLARAGSGAACLSLPRRCPPQCLPSCAPPPPPPPRRCCWRPPRAATTTATGRCRRFRAAAAAAGSKVRAHAPAGGVLGAARLRRARICPHFGVAAAVRRRIAADPLRRLRRARRAAARAYRRGAPRRRAAPARVRACATRRAAAASVDCAAESVCLFIVVLWWSRRRWSARRCRLGFCATRQRFARGRAAD
jgi:hypothetical protein